MAQVRINKPKYSVHVMVILENDMHISKHAYKQTKISPD